jgi:hypothetical protein
MDDVSEQFRIFVGFFVVQIYQSSVKSNNIISDYYSGVKSVWPPELTCIDLAGLEILMGFWLQAPFSQPIQV